MDNNESLLEAGLFHVGSFWDASPYGMVDNRGNYGVGMDFRTRFWAMSFGGNYRRLWRKDIESSSDTNSTNDYTHNLLGDSFEQISSSLSMPFVLGSYSLGTVSYRYSYNKRQADTTESHGLNWRAQLWRTNDYDIDFDFGLSKSGDNEVALLNLNFRFRQDRWNFRATPSTQWNTTASGTERDERLLLNTGWADGDLYDADVRFDGGISTNSREDRINSRLRYANHVGSADASVTHVRSDDNHTTSYSLNMGTSFMTNGEYVSLGGQDRNQSAVVVYVDGRPGDRFDVLVNGRRETYAVVGQPTLVSLSPYRQYRISLKPAGTALYRFDEKVQEVTLYPGNVVRMDVEALPLQLAFGRISFNGASNINARITGGLAPVSVDEYGLFQLEIPADIPALRVEMDNGWACQIELPKDNGKNILRLGTVKLSEANCQPWIEGELVISKKD